MNKRGELVFELAEAPLPGLVSHCASLAHLKSARPRNSDAANLNQRLKPVSAPAHHLEAWHNDDAENETQAENNGLLAHIPRLAASVGNLMQPQGDTHNDDSTDQRIVNLVTCLPFFALGAHMMNRNRTPEGREYALTMHAVGAAATLYHATSGNFRRVARKLDYWTIAVSSTSMTKAIYPQKPWVRRFMTASLAAIPFKPFLVSTVNTLLMQAEFARQAAKHESMRPHFKRHVAAAGLSAVAFAVEDLLLEKGFGHVHGLWHLLAAAGVATTGALVEHKEQLKLAEIRANTEIIKGLRPVHDSAASLQSLNSYSKPKAREFTPGSSP